MMKLLKNKEVARSFLLQVVLSALGTTTTYILDNRAGLVTLGACLSLILIHWISTYRRYRQIAALSADITKVLYGDDTISVLQYTEGELGVLHSEIYKMTVRLREQQKKLIQDKVFLADSIADISHQIRTPLTSVNLMVELLADPKTKEERKPQLIRELQTMLTRMDWLMTALLKISKLDAGTVVFNKETIAAQTLVEQSCAPLLVPMELREQNLVIRGNGRLTCDVSWTSEAITNVVKNCIEHTPLGGLVEIETAENALYTELVVRDTGTGISHKDMPHIFDRFYKGEGSDDKSFGIGLALARMIVAGQRGTIKAENRKPTGAQFTIRFYKSIV